MAKLAIKKASTDVTVYLFIQDSSVTTGAGKTGLAYNTSSLVAYYVRPLGSATQLTLATQTVTGAHSDGGFVEVDATNMPGVYRLDLSDAICATGVNSVVVMLKGAANMAPVVLEIQLTSYDPNDAGAEIADAVLDEVVMGSYTLRQLVKVLAAKMAGKATGGGTTTITYRGVDDASNVIVETVDSSGNRSAVTLTV